MSSGKSRRELPGHPTQLSFSGFSSSETKSPPKLVRSRMNWASWNLFGVGTTLDLRLIAAAVEFLSLTLPSLQGCSLRGYVAHRIEARLHVTFARRAGHFTGGTRLTSSCTPQSPPCAESILRAQSGQLTCVALAPVRAVSRSPISYPLLTLTRKVRFPYTGTSIGGIAGSPAVSPFSRKL